MCQIRSYLGQATGVSNIDRATFPFGSTNLRPSRFASLHLGITLSGYTSALSFRSLHMDGATRLSVATPCSELFSEKHGQSTWIVTSTRYPGCLILRTDNFSRETSTGKGGLCNSLEKNDNRTSFLWAPFSPDTSVHTCDLGEWYNWPSTAAMRLL